MIIGFAKKTIECCAFAGICLLFTGCATTTQTHPLTAAGLAGLETAPADEEKTGKLEKASYDDLFRDATAYLAEGNLQLARLHFVMAAKKNPQSAPAYTGLGTTLAREQRHREAQAAFGKALAIDKDYVPALVAMGQLHRRAGKYLKTEKYLNRAMGLRPEDPVILTELAITLDSLGREKEAEVYYLQTVELKPEDDAARNNLGFNYLLQGRYDEAAGELRKALSQAPTDNRIQNNLAAAYALSGQEEHAFRLLVRSVGEAGAYNNIGYIYMTKGEWEKAEKAFKNALQVNPSFYAKAKSNLDHLRRMKTEPM